MTICVVVPNLRRVYVLIDSRHGLKPNDIEVMTTLDKAAVNYQVVLTKVDKTKLSDYAGRSSTRCSLGLKKRPAAHPDILLTSSDKKIGIKRLPRRNAAAWPKVTRARPRQSGNCALGKILFTLHACRFTAIVALHARQ